MTVARRRRCPTLCWRNSGGRRSLLLRLIVSLLRLLIIGLLLLMLSLLLLLLLSVGLLLLLWCEAQHWRREREHSSSSSLLHQRGHRGGVGWRRAC